MNNRLDRSYSIWGLIKFTIPSMLNLLVMSVYQMADAIFIANYVGENALAALNMVYPAISVVLAVTLMLATGGSAAVAKAMGEGHDRQAKEDFTMITLAAAVVSSLISLACWLFLDPLLTALGTTPALWADSRAYLAALMPFMPLAALQMVFLSFFITAGKPGLGLFLTVLSGLTNVALDSLFVARLGWGVRGAAWATAIGYGAAALPGLIAFLMDKGGTLHLVRPRLRIKVLGQACFNGSSEMVSNLSVSVTTLMFNKMALKYLGETGVAAVTVALYAQFLLTAIFIGFISGVGPVISFNYGSRNSARQTRLFRQTLGIVLAMTVLVLLAAYLLAQPIVAVFIQRDSAAFPLALHGFILFSLSYLFAGFNIYASGLFTALNNGRASAAISFLRTFVLLAAALTLLPRVMGADGIWLAVPLAEMLSCAVSVWLMVRHQKEYHFTLRDLSYEG